MPPCGSAKRHSGSSRRSAAISASRRSRSSAIRSGISSSSRGTICAATSWSSTAPPMSIDARSAASRCTRSRGGADPADAQAAPHRLGQRADHDHRRVDRGGAARTPPSKPSSTNDSSTTTVVPVWRAVRRTSRRASSRHQRAGRVVEVGDEVGQPRRGLAQRGPHRGDVPAAAGRHRHGDESRADAAHAVDRAGVGGQLGQHPVARADQQLQQQVEARASRRC